MILSFWLPNAKKETGMVSIEVVNGYINVKTRRKNYVLNQNLIEKVFSKTKGVQIDLL
jgi:hypothetical protein